MGDTSVAVDCEVAKMELVYVVIVRAMLGEAQTHVHGDERLKWAIAFGWGIQLGLETGAEMQV